MMFMYVCRLCMGVLIFLCVFLLSIKVLMLLYSEKLMMYIFDFGCVFVVLYVI